MIGKETSNKSVLNMRSKLESDEAEVTPVSS